MIAHIMSHFTGLTEEPVEVLYMYDGMSCGHIALDKNSLGQQLMDIANGTIVAAARWASAAVEIDDDEDQVEME